MGINLIKAKMNHVLFLKYSETFVIYIFNINYYYYFREYLSWMYGKLLGTFIKVTKTLPN